ncbi:MAG: hypothetical protein CXT75_05290 [Methanobacteriota archaeon]|nr:MAG: hypothetical protein CXT75_05290 [Euryarchaeota archaeon]
MQSNRRQILSFVAILMMVASAFAFTPSARAEASLDTSLEGFYNEYSFASVNGTAEYDVTFTNNGDVDFDTVSITAAFQDTSWKIENVTFSTSEESNNGTLSLPLAAGGLAQVHVSVFVGYGAKINFAQVPLTLDINTDDGPESSIVAIVCVTNWIAYESNYPSLAELNTYNKGDSYNYNLTVENIAVTFNPDNTTSPIDINDNIQLQYFSLSGWSVTCNNNSWHPFYGGQLEGMLADEVKTWEITVNLTGNVQAGEDILNFEATSTNPDDPFSMPYNQPYGLTVIPVNAAEWYGVGVSGAGMRNADVSEGSAIQTCTFDLTWNLGNIPAGWTISAIPTTSGAIGWQGSSNFDVSLTVPADALSGSSASFLMTATSSSSSIETATQTFEVVVDQHYGVSIEVDTESKNGAPGSNVEFSFNLTNTGNGEDTFDIVVEGPSMWSPMSSVSSLMIDAVSSGQFLVSVMVPTTMTANSNSGDIKITVTSSDNETTLNSTISVVASQVFDINIAYGTGSDGTVTISEDTSLQIKLNITNNGNGIDTLSLKLVNAPNWATLGADTLIVGTIPVPLVITLSPDTAAVSGRDYTFQVIATSLDGTEWTSPDLTADIEAKATDSTDVVEEVLEEEDDSPGFGVLASLLAFTFVVYGRRKD